MGILPDLTRTPQAWKAHFSVHGCVSCLRKKVAHASGGLCEECQRRITMRMRTCFRKVNAHRNTPDDVASLSRKFQAAQLLFNGDT